MNKYLELNGVKNLWATVKKLVNDNVTNINSSLSILTAKDTELATQLTNLTTTVNTLIDNPDDVINSFNEIVAFLANIKDETTLEGIVNGINQTITNKVNEEKTNRETADNNILSRLIKATSTKDGFMSKEDKAKLDTIAENANNYTLPAASITTLGGIKIGDNLKINNEKLNLDDYIIFTGTWNSNSNKYVVTCNIDGFENIKNAIFVKNKKCIYVTNNGTNIVDIVSKEYYSGSNEHINLKGTIIDSSKESLLEIIIKTDSVSITSTPLINYINVTYNELCNLRNGKNLIPGVWYRLTDYKTITVQDHTTVVGETNYIYFDILVLATDIDKLLEEARVIQSDNASNSSSVDYSNISFNAWKIWYCLDNDISRFIWADEENGKGVIYRMIDEWNNDCGFDFKNILHDGYYTFSYFSNNTQIANLYDGSINDNSYKFVNNYIERYYVQDALDSSAIQTIPHIIVYGITVDSASSKELYQIKNNIIINCDYIYFNGCNNTIKNSMINSYNTNNDIIDNSKNVCNNTIENCNLYSDLYLGDSIIYNVVQHNAIKDITILHSKINKFELYSNNTTNATLNITNSSINAKCTLSAECNKLQITNSKFYGTGICESRQLYIENSDININGTIYPLTDVITIIHITNSIIPNGVSGLFIDNTNIVIDARNTKGIYALKIPNNITYIKINCIYDSDTINTDATIDLTSLSLTSNKLNIYKDKNNELIIEQI